MTAPIHNQLRQLTCLWLGLTSLVSLSAVELPEGYTLQYEQSFNSKNSYDDFMMTDSSAWELQKKKGNQFLALEGKSKYDPPHRSPLNIALIKGKTFGSFVLEVDILQSGVKGTPIAQFMKENPDPTKAGGYATETIAFSSDFRTPLTTCIFT